MRAVNLFPSDSTRSGRPATAEGRAVYLVLGLLALAVGLVTVYVLTGNTISSRQAQLTSLQSQLAQEQAQAERLGNYSQFAQLAQTRAQTVREIAATRFDWHGAMADLSKVVPANTSLQSLNGTVVPQASAGSSGGTSASSASGLRGDLAGPAFELSGCTDTQDDVARLMSRLRVINGVTRVSLGSSQENGTAQGAGGSGSSTAGCKPNAPTFDIIVFFAPVSGAGPNGPTSLTSSGAGGTPSSAGGAASSAGGAPTSAASSAAHSPSLSTSGGTN